MPMSPHEEIDSSRRRGAVGANFIMGVIVIHFGVV